MAKKPNTTTTKTSNAATVSVFQDGDGNVLAGNDRAAIGKAFRVLAEAMQEGSTEDLSDDQIAAVVMAIPGQGDDVQMARVQAVVDFEPVTHDMGSSDTLVAGDVSIASEGIALATNMARAMNTASFEAILVKLEDARETLNIGPLSILDAWCGISVKDADGNIKQVTVGLYGETEAKARDRIADMPLPGTSAKKGDNNPDKFTRPYINAKGESRMRNTTFFGELFDHTEHGRKIERLLADLDDPKTEAGAQLDTDKTRARGRWQGRRQTVVGRFRTARKVERQRSLVEDRFGGSVIILFARKLDADGHETVELDNTPKCIGVFNRANGKGEYVSIGTFLGWDVAAAKSKTVEGLKATVGRDRSGSKTNDKKKLQVPTADIAEGWFAMLATGGANEEWMGTLEKRMTRAGSDPLVRSMGDLYHYLSMWYNPEFGRYRKRYDTIKQEDADRAIADQQNKAPKRDAA